MSGGEALGILAADRASRARRARRSGATDSEWSPFFGSMYKADRPVRRPHLVTSEPGHGSRLVPHSWMTILVVIAADIVVVLIAAGGGLA
jgi:hypothetical protein